VVGYHSFGGQCCFHLQDEAPKLARILW